VSAESGTGVELAVVIPACDAADTLPSQLRALAAGGYTGRWEVIVVNDACRDETVAVAEATAESTGLDVRVVSTGRRSGPSLARNTGAALTDAPLILFCDADDVVSAGWVARMAHHLEAAPVVTGRLRSDLLNDPVLAASRGPGDRSPSFLGLFPTVSAGNMGVRREAWEVTGGFDVDLAAFEDAEWASRAALAGLEVAWAADAVVDYRFRTRARELWRQGKRYGAGRPLVARRWFDATGERPSRLAGLRSWVWLVLHLIDLWSHTGRARWCWVAGNRLGSVTGSIRARFILL
jgi:glycosyltransferase involved in cell wall biosynthesis